MRADGGSPNLINGVSRQPAEVRLPSQLEESINQFPSVTKGLVPRNPALFRARVAGGITADVAAHIIDRDADERYVVRASSTAVQITDLSGVAKTVSAPDGYGYLTGATQDDLELTTVADHTFVLNRAKVVLAGMATAPTFGNEALVHVVSGDYHTDYRVLVNGILVARYKTGGGPTETAGQGRDVEQATRPKEIATILRTGALSFAPKSGAGFALATATEIYENLSVGLPSPTWAVTQYDNVLHIKNLAGVDFSIAVEAAGAPNSIRVHKNLVTVYSDLPRVAPPGFRIRVSGSKETDYDDYHVVFDQPAFDGLGRWKETVGPGVPLGLDPATMPHLLVRNSDGTFTFKQAEWAIRGAGDLETSPDPSFVGQALRGAMFFKNRIGFFAGENIVFSRNGHFFDFFIQTAQTILDDDPIDLAISYPEVSTIHHAVPFSGELVLFTASVPFRLVSGELFTPKSASTEPLLSNKVNSVGRPQTAGDKLFFVNEAPSGSFAHEFTYDRQAGVKQAPSISEHVNGYIPSNVRLLQVDDSLKLLALVSSAEPAAIYTYKWLWIGQDRAQSAWQKWTLPYPVRAIRFVGEELVVVTDHTTAHEILAINCHEAWTGDIFANILLDRRVVLTGAYAAGDDTTSFSLPYPAVGTAAVISDPASFGHKPEVVSSTGTTLTVAGDYGGKEALIGEEFESYGILSEFVAREKVRGGGQGNAIPNINLKVANLSLGTGTSAFLKVVVSRAYRPDFTYEKSAYLTGTKKSHLGSLVVGAIPNSMSVLADATDTSIRFGSNGPFPYAVLSYRWSGSQSPKGY